MLKILVYGCGKIANKMIDDGLKEDIIGWVQSTPNNDYYKGKRVYSIESLPDYDVIIVANSFCEEISIKMKELGVNTDNVLFYYKCSGDRPGDKIELAKAVFSEKNLNIWLSNEGLFEESFYYRDVKKYNSLNTRKTFMINQENNRPIITDKYDDMGVISDYFWESLWAAKKIIECAPIKHYDIGSRLNDYLLILLAARIPLCVIDVRPFPVDIDGLETIVDDATKLSQFEDGSIESLSALDSLSHFGLGRYGDEVNPEGCFECFQSIQKKMKPGGVLYISVPIGEERVCFNAHRVFNPLTIVNEFSGCDLLSFSTVCDGRLKENLDIEQYREYKGTIFTRGLYLFRKKGE